MPKLPCGDMGSTRKTGCNPCPGASMATTVGTDIWFKLGKLLHAWHPSDPSAYAILSPWKTVFDSDSWERLISQFILPKLEEALLKFQVRHMVTMLEVGFFPKWQQVLHLWMCWKVFTAEAAELLANDWIRHQLHIGLDMMNQAVKVWRQFQAQQKAAAYAQDQAAAIMGIGLHADCMNEVPEMSLKEILGVHAQSMSCCLNQSLAGHIMTEGGWSLVSLDRLLEMQR
ncbi:hypothetical protein MKW92_032681 [Papaver armeniacum]|nr:hypothetical protein MKW92_032681 [Papaver armeniacum]